MWKIDNIEIKNQVVMAPMAGISNPSYMKIIEQMGCDLALTELISTEAVIRNNKKTLDMLNGINDLKMKVGIQIFGANPETMAKAAKMLCETYDVDLIDINMGCPVPKVAIHSSAGSGLLKEPEKVRQIVLAVKNAVNVPVTVKIRSGWDENSINAVEIAKIIEQAGASAITIHPRTRAQGYSGKADWNIIKEIKKNVKIPVIGNGDIKTVYDAKRMLDETSCDAIMVGRALLGNPWLIKDIINYLENGTLPCPVQLEQKIEMIKKHLNLLVKYKNEKTALLEIRSHISWYLKGEKNSKEIKELICKATTRAALSKHSPAASSRVAPSTRISV